MTFFMQAVGFVVGIVALWCVVMGGICLFKPGTAEGLTTRGRAGLAFAVGIGLFVGIDASGIYKTSPEEQARRDAERAARATEQAELEAARAADRAAAERERAVNRCFSPWDNSNRSLVSHVENRLYDPESFDHVATVARYTEDEGVLEVLMDYRAANLYGAQVPYRATGHVVISNCASILLTNEPRL